MKYLLILPFLALPATAQEADAPSAMEKGLRLFMDGLMQEMEPALRDLEDLAEGARPLLERWGETLGSIDLNRYHAPEVLENGDILIRRKQDDETEVVPNEDGSIDL